MAISRKPDGSLGLNDILIEIGANKGDTIDFVSLASALGMPTSNIVLPDSFIGKSLSLSSLSATASPTTLSFLSAGEEKPIQITATGLYRLSNLPNWIVADKTFASSTSTFNIRATDNSLLGTETRTGSILVVGRNNSTIATINLSQVGNPATFTISPTTLAITTAATASTITLTLSNILEVVSTSLSNTTGFSIRDAVIKTVGATTTTHKYTLDTEQNVSGARSSTISFQIAGGGFVNTLSTAVSQAGFVETLSIATSALSFVQGGETKFFDVVSNTSWTSDISGTGYQQSLSSTSGFTTSNLSGNNNDRVYIKALSNSNTSTRTGTVSVAVTDGTPSDSVSLSQAAFVETLSIATSALSFSPDGETEFFDVVSNTAWVSDVSGTGYEQSLSSTSGFVTTDLTGTGNDRIYIRIAENTGTTRRDGSVSVTVSDGNPSDSVSFTQNPKPIWTDSNILISGFDVDEFGDITVPSILTSLSYSITYTTSANAGTSYSAADGFPLVGLNTIRYVNVTVNVPDTFQNPGPYTKTASAIQEERSYGIDEIFIGTFNVSDTGTITVPSISATDNPSITTTYTFGPNIGSTTTAAKGFPAVLNDTTRYVNASLTVPSGWFNTGTSITRTKSTIQPGATLDGNLYYPANTTQTFNNWSPGSIGGSYTNTSFFGANDTTPIYLTFSLRTNVIVNYVVQEFGDFSFSIVQPTNDFQLTDNEFTTQLDVTPYNTHFRLKCDPSLISQGDSVSTRMIFTTTDTNNARFEIDITLGKLQSSTVGVNPTVDSTVSPTVSPTVRPKPQI